MDGFFDGFFWVMAATFAVLTFIDWYIGPKQRKCLKEKIGWWGLQLGELSVSGLLSRGAFHTHRALSFLVGENGFSLKRISSAFIMTFVSAPVVTALYFLIGYPLATGGDLRELIAALPIYLEELSAIHVSLPLLYPTTGFAAILFSFVFLLISSELFLRIFSYIERTDKIFSTIIGLAVLIFWTTLGLFIIWVSIRFSIDLLVHDPRVTEIIRKGTSSIHVIYLRTMLILSVPFIATTVCCILFIVPITIFIIVAATIFANFLLRKFLRGPLATVFDRFYNSTKAY